MNKLSIREQAEWELKQEETRRQIDAEKSRILRRRAIARWFWSLVPFHFFRRKQWLKSQNEN